MCAPALIVTAISTAVSMAGQYQQYKAESKAAQQAAEYNQAVAEDQAKVSNALAQNEISKGIADRERQQRAAARQMGEMRSGLAAGGFEMDSGSGMNLLAESAVEHQYDANIISNNASMSAWQHQANANSALNEAGWQGYQRTQAKGSKTAQWLGMGGSLLGGVAQGMGQYNDWKKTRTPGQ